jgi:hypothetical protein
VRYPRAAACFEIRCNPLPVSPLRLPASASALAPAPAPGTSREASQHHTESSETVSTAVARGHVSVLSRSPAQFSQVRAAETRAPPARLDTWRRRLLPSKVVRSLPVSSRRPLPPPPSPSRSRVSPRMCSRRASLPLPLPPPSRAVAPPALRPVLARHSVLASSHWNRNNTNAHPPPNTNAEPARIPCK